MHFEAGIAHLDGFDFEINPDGSDVVGLEFVLAEPDEDVGLPNASVSDDDDLREKLLTGFHDNTL